MGHSIGIPLYSQLMWVNCESLVGKYSVKNGLRCSIFHRQVLPVFLSPLMTTFTVRRSRQTRRGVALAIKRTFVSVAFGLLRCCVRLCSE